MIWFTADPEFDHGNIIHLSHRPFKSLDDMNAQMIERWNSKVSPNDTIYIVGDFAYKDEFGFAKQLNGNKFLIPGNHDHLRKEKVYADNLTILPPLFELKIPDLSDEYGNKRLIVLCHYSLRSWNKSHYCSWHIFGHHHGMLEPYGLSFDCGVDTNNFYPYSLDDVKAKMATLTPIVDYRRPPVNV